MALGHNATFVTQGLVFCLDSANPRSTYGNPILQTSSASNFATNQNVTITQVGPYVSVKSNQTDSTPGAWPIGGVISVSPSTQYTLRVKGYVQSGSTAYLYVTANASGDLVWTGSPLTSTNQYVQNVFTTGASDTSIRVGILWSAPALNSTIIVESVELYNTNTVRDVTGNGNDFTTGGNLTFTTNNGWSFSNGSTSKYMIKNPITMPTATLSYEIWCQTTVAGTALLSYASTAADNDFLLFNPGSLSLYTAISSVASGISITDGNWKQIVRTSNRTTGAEVLYVNGSNSYSTTLSAGTLVTSGGSFVVAQEQDSIGGGFDPNQAFGGNIAIVRLYNTVLTDSQVLQNFEAARGRFGI